ncbi:uncharacterized protein [Solanum tuberosum]|uniref:uncharacterized protein isoform X1 n=1 Tax=Solanum tuberosum TaxID=4113 RepID=UPI00073A0CEC|nr:PREDICTED: uncharacterized protein LOC107058577 isoform X1 [Solanum tuberosum]XP_015159918.1 PREDICTED: uncharacterized protein LOC107058577 isoform X1 [Solanum tuberosum]
MVTFRKYVTNSLDILRGGNSRRKHLNKISPTQPANDYSSIRNNLQAFAAQPNFTLNQYQKIVHLLKEEEQIAGTTNMAGNSNKTAFLSIKDNEYAARKEDCVVMNGRTEPNCIRKENWIVDSGATCHMTSSLKTLNKVYTSNRNIGRKVYLPNGQSTLMTHSGSCVIQTGGELENVLVVPEFKHDLMSVSQLTRHLNCSVHFFPDFCVFQDLFNGEVKGIGKEIEGLCFFPRQFSSIQKQTDVGETKALMTHSDNSQCIVWHNRLGHPSIKVLR